jgi:hypothetical protein
MSVCSQSSTLQLEADTKSFDINCTTNMSPVLVTEIGTGLLDLVRVTHVLLKTRYNMSTLLSYIMLGEISRLSKKHRNV